MWQGYSTYLDFDQWPRSEEGGLAINHTAPSQVEGPWRLASDVPTDPYKTGWLYEKLPGRGPEKVEEDSNLLEFHCHNITFGRMKIGYTSSYGECL